MHNKGLRLMQLCNLPPPSRSETLTDGLIYSTNSGGLVQKRICRSCSGTAAVKSPRGFDFITSETSPVRNSTKNKLN